MKLGKLRFALASATLAASLVLASVTFADGPSRPATPQEKAFYEKVMSTLEKAAPPGPAGWEITDRTEAEALERVGEGSGAAPMYLDYFIQWDNRPVKEAAEQAMVQAGNAAMKRDMEENPTGDGQDSFEKLAEKLGEAVNRGDMAEALRIQKRMEAVGQELSQAYQQREEVMEEAVRAHERKDVSMRLMLIVNSFSEDLVGYEEEEALSGMRVFRSQGESSAHSGWTEGTTIVFAGPGWQLLRDGDSVWMSAELRELPHTRAQTLVVSVRAEEARARKTLDSLDWTALRGLLNKADY